MQLENQITKQTYILLMIETLQKKLVVLNQLLLLTQQQEELVSSEMMKEDEFFQMVSLKEEQLKNLTKLDEGFEKLYASVKEELITGKDKYVSEITSLKELIVSITDLSVKLQAIESRNRPKVELFFSRKRMDIKSSRISSQSVTNYYKTMTKQHENQSFFYDKKK